MTKQTKTIAGLAAGAAVAVVVTVGIVVTVRVERDPPPPTPAPTADDPVRRLAEQELEQERQAQENNRQVRQGLQNAAQKLKDEQAARGEGVYSLTGGREALERKQEEQRQQARAAKAKAAGFDTWEAYQQSLQNPATRPTKP